MSQPACPIHGLPNGEAAEGDPTAVEVPAPRFPGYRTLFQVGRGGFGAVYAAEPEAGGGRVAIKVAHGDRPDAALRLVHEIAVLSDVGPPHVPAVFGSGELAEGAPFVVLEYVDAETLAERLAGRAQPFTVREAITVALSVLRALSAVHARGWVHRDLKPENLFVGARSAKIVDFGLVVRAAERVDRSAEGAVGTAEYMAPEQCERFDDIDARADIYAIGVILFEMIAGAPPFWGPPAAVQQAHLGRRPPRLALAAAEADVPRALDDVVQRCLAKDRAERFESAAAVSAALEAVLADLPAAPGERAISRAPRALDSLAPGERRAVSLLFFESEVDVVTVQRRASAHGGELAHASGARAVLVYGHDLGDNPARVALRAAYDLIRGGVAARVRLDVAHVAVQTRADGSRRFLSPLFGRRDRFPSRADPPGVSVTDAAVSVLAEPGAVSAAPPAGAAAASPAAVALADEPRLDTLVGRDTILAALTADARRAALDREPTIAVVIGEAGHGKTHLFRALSRDLAAPGVEVIALRAQEPALGAERTVRALLQRILDLPAAPPAEGAVDLLRERLARSGGADAAPAVALALGWVEVNAPEQVMESGLRTLEAAPGALRSALTTAAGEALRQRAAAQPVLILLDDAHLTDEATLAVLEYAALAEAGAPLWICALGRPAFAEERGSWGGRAGRREEHRIDPLAPAAAAALCRRLLLPVESVPDDAVARLCDRARGVPLLLCELVRGLHREGLVRKRPSGDAYYLATDEIDRVPDLPLVEWLARRELSALPEALAAHACLLALLGEEVSIADAAGVLSRLDEQGGADDLPLDAKVATRRLLDAGLLVQDAGAVIRFRHGLVREAIAQGVPEAMRRGVHLAAAHHHAEAEGDDDRRLALLAFHAAHAGLSAWAEGAYLRLAERMRARHAYLPAERAYSRALSQARGDDALRLRALRGRGLMRYRIGRYHDAIADLQAARALAHDLGDADAEVDVLLDEATVLDWTDEYKSSEERVEEARALAAPTRSPLIEARILLGVGRSAQRFSREEEAVPSLEAAAARAAALGDEGYETLVIALMLLGFSHQALGRPEEARRVFDRAIALSEARGDLLHLATAINNSALLWGCAGDHERMLVHLERVVALARALGQDLLELSASFNLAEVLYLLDRLDAAELPVRRAIEIDRRLSGDTGRPVVRVLEARFRYYRGEEAEARDAAAAIRAGQAEALAAGRTDALLVPSEDVLLQAVELAVGDAAAAWDVLEERSARFSVGQEHVEVLDLRGVAALRAGRIVEAIATLRRATEAAERIPNVMGDRLRRHLAEAEHMARAGFASTPV